MSAAVVRAFTSEGSWRTMRPLSKVEGICVFHLESGRGSITSANDVGGSPNRASSSASATCSPHRRSAPPLAPPTFCTVNVAAATTINGLFGTQHGLMGCAQARPMPGSAASTESLEAVKERGFRGLMDLSVRLVPERIQFARIKLYIGMWFQDLRNVVAHESRGRTASAPLCFSAVSDVHLQSPHLWPIAAARGSTPAAHFC